MSGGGLTIEATQRQEYGATRFNGARCWLVLDPTAVQCTAQTDLSPCLFIPLPYLSKNSAFRQSLHPLAPSSMITASKLNAHFRRLASSGSSSYRRKAHRKFPSTHVTSFSISPFTHISSLPYTITLLCIVGLAVHQSPTQSRNP